MFDLYFDHCDPQTIFDVCFSCFLGKTYTVLSGDGLIPTTVRQLFLHIKGDKDHTYKVNLSYLQIYQERIFDLLDATKKTDLHLREHPQEGVLKVYFSMYIFKK